MVFAKIKEYLESNGIKQKWLAHELGITESKLSLMLTGKSPIYSDMLFQICDVLGVSSNLFKPRADQSA